MEDNIKEFNPKIITTYHIGQGAVYRRKTTDRLIILKIKFKFHLSHIAMIQNNYIQLILNE